MTLTREPDSRYSWFLAIVGATTLVFTLGTPFSYGVFLEPFAEHYQLSEVSLSFVFAVHLFAAYSIAGVLVVFATRYEAHHVLLVMGALMAFLAPSLYVIESLLGLLVVFTLLGTALGTVLIILISIIPQWFERAQGLATGVVFVGIGLSLFVLPPGWNLAIEAIGIRDGFLAIVGIGALLILASGLVCRYPPWVPTTTVSFPELNHWLAHVLRTRRFYFLFFGFGLAFSGFFLVAGFSISLFETRGMTRAVATVTFGLIGGTSIVSRIASGAIADRYGYELTYRLSLAAAVLGCVILLLPGVISVYIAVVFFGISLGGITTLFVPIALGVYDPDKATAIIGIFSVGLGIAALAAPPVATTLVSATDSFQPVIILTLLTAVVAMVLVWLGATTR